MALLTSALTAKAFADKAETNVELATSRAPSSHTFVRDVSAASAVTETHELTSVDDEDRKLMTLAKFAEIMGLDSRNGVCIGLKRRYFDRFVYERMTPKAVYPNLDLSVPEQNILSNHQWIGWAYLVCQFGHPFEEDLNKFIVAAMLVIYDAETLSNILITGVTAEKTNYLAMNLAKVADDHIKSLLLDKLPGLRNELSHQKQHIAGEMYKTRRDRIFDYLRKNVNSNMLSHEKFSILTSYLSILLNKEHADGTMLLISREVSKDAGLLRNLLLLDNFRDQGCLENLVSIWLDVYTPPSKVVSMLVQDMANADQFTTLYLNAVTKSFWLHYLKVYNRSKFNVEDFTSNVDLDFQRLLMTLHTVGVPESFTAESKHLATSTVLKILLLPEIAGVISAQKYLKELTSMWLKERLTPPMVVYMLLLAEKEGDYFQILFINAQSSKYWEEYANAFHAETKILQNIKIATLIDFFGETKLRSVLEAASTVEATREKAESLLAQFNWWTKG